MINEDELTFQRLKYERINSEIKANFQTKPGKLGPWQIHKGIDSHKTASIPQQILKNQNSQ